MKNDAVKEKDKQPEEPIVIADECGDSLWDAVLGQEIKACPINVAIFNADKSSNNIESLQVVEKHDAKEETKKRI